MASFIANLLHTVGLIRKESEPVPQAVPVPEAPSEPAELADDAVEPVGAKSIDLDALMTEVLHRRTHEREEKLAREMGLDASWKTIFTEAGLAVPAHGWTVEKALALIRRAEARGMTPVQVRQSLEAALIESGADVTAVAKDALAKDEVLDVYEGKLDNAVGAHLEGLANEIRDLHEQIEAIQGRVATLEQERVGAVRRLNAWKGEKRHLEQQWAKVMTTIAPLLRGSY